MQAGDANTLSRFLLQFGEDPCCGDEVLYTQRRAPFQTFRRGYNDDAIGALQAAVAVRKFLEDSIRPAGPERKAAGDSFAEFQMKFRGRLVLGFLHAEPRARYISWLQCRKQQFFQTRQ